MSMTLAELQEAMNLVQQFREALKLAGVSNVQELARRLDDDYRATAAWHDGYATGFKYAHTMQQTMQMCERSLERIHDFEIRLVSVNKMLRRIEKKISE